MRPLGYVGSRQSCERVQDSPAEPQDIMCSAAMTEKAEEKHFSTAAGPPVSSCPGVMSHAMEVTSHAHQVFQTVTSQGVRTVGCTAWKVWGFLVSGVA